MTGEKDKEIAKRLDAEAIQQWVTNSFEKVLEAQLPLATNTVSRLRRVHPDKTPEQLISF
ncbi:hypothetical protein [Corynebacterium cystitidis]|uniref:Uncharacterized protein n=1 Tax=Corynebacterium cystitidis DSM 20524 TaxID=1121357 RepID=A0A1H9UX29_9CORY|nr:hypothetical protein [Corynebacterium cystitidis]WJY83680.1 hypothetical protein CCYS_13995 [Corynebacterium cystitidis DSM 20524]SES13607.1 hypothetical protein SAMN05661109_01956 [Corynebacterium cystitidis DSM 20524]SNV91351.1 Uncharacterised protein [Corynebacterium cystitidis]